MKSFPLEMQIEGRRFFMFLIAYDICDPARLRRVARLLERHALRCQYSVFLFSGDSAAVAALLDAAASRMDLQCDIIQAWRIRSARADSSRGSLVNIEPSAVILGPGSRYLLPPVVEGDSSI
jgi:CRISPR-associated endonuclease Cas2